MWSQRAASNPSTPRNTAAQDKEDFIHFKKLRHENLAELGIAEAKEHGEVSFCWIPGKTNPADVLTKEDNDVAHCCGLRDPMVKSRES